MIKKQSISSVERRGRPWRRVSRKAMDAYEDFFFPHPRKPNLNNSANFENNENWADPLNEVVIDPPRSLYDIDSPKSNDPWFVMSTPIKRDKNRLNVTFQDYPRFETKAKRPHMFDLSTFNRRPSRMSFDFPEDLTNLDNLEMCTLYSTLPNFRLSLNQLRNLEESSVNLIRSCFSFLRRIICCFRREAEDEIELVGAEQV